MTFTRGGDSRQRDAAQETSEERERVSSACSHAGGAVGNLLAEPKSVGNEDTWNKLVAKFSSKDHAAVSGAAAEAVLRVPPRGKMEIRPHGARTTTTPPRCSSTSSAPAAPSQDLEAMVNDFPT